MSQVLKSIFLQNFRGFVDQKIDCNQNVTLLVGANGSGKTSILEAIGLLATGQSFRAEKVEEMVRLGVELGRVEGKIQVGDRQIKDATTTRHSESMNSSYHSRLACPETSGDPESQNDHSFNYVELTSNSDITLSPHRHPKLVLETIDLEVMITRGEVQGKKSSKRLLSVNGVRRRLGDFVGKFATVVFRPEDMRLIEGSPSRRREFLDTPLSFISQEYARSLHTYNQSLIRRNKLLQAIREGEAPRTSLTYWTESILKHGQILQNYRQQMLTTYLHSPFPLGFRIKYLPSIISVDRLSQYADKEIAAGHTLIGPHKDDFQVDFLLAQPTSRHPGLDSRSSNSPYHDVAAYGSRGQQRLAVLWLKLCELYYLENQLGQRPILLLDDILSELDTDSRELVLQVMKQGQSIITTASTGIAKRIAKNFPRSAKVQL